MNLDVSFGYTTEHPDTSSVAIVGAREFIFSQNIGILGDIAAAKNRLLEHYLQEQWEKSDLNFITAILICSMEYL